MPRSVAQNGNSPAGDDSEPYDLVCIGFGPASLAIAIALRERNDLHDVPKKVLFLERQPHFAWHSGMLLPGSRMQISFIKDLATMRNPRSEFTFINYLHQNGRLANFMNLGTFLPLREEYNDYMSWCASHFTPQVQYNQSAISIRSVGTPATSFEVTSKHTTTHSRTSFTARNVVIATGGTPSLPPNLPASNPRILHSSQYSTTLPTLLPTPSAPYNIAIIGAGQSSAEIFHDLHTRFPNAKTSLFIRAPALKPSDDSPFVNEIFDPERVGELFSLPAPIRAHAITHDRATNYSVVRIELLETLYHDMYRQRLRNPDSTTWQHRIYPLTETIGIVSGDDEKVRLRLRNTRTGEEVPETAHEGFDAVVCGTGYERNVHETLLAPVRELMEEGECVVGRDYRVRFREGRVREGCGVFLQGCCEKTHGLSDTLLSILAVRGGEIVESVFGAEKRAGREEMVRSKI